MNTHSNMAALFVFPFVAAALALVVVPASHAQDVQGMVDVRQSAENQIEQLERLVGGDSPAGQQVVVYQWLIELYDYVGRPADVNRCYRTILSLYPGDVATLNAYGRYLMERAESYERADSVLRVAYRSAMVTDSRSIDLGNSLQTSAELNRRMGRYDRSVALSERALALLDEDRSGDVLRTMARSLVELERYDEAAEAYLRVIALDGGANPEDINSLQVFAAKTTKYNTQSTQRLVEQTIADYRKRYLARIELEGGAVVEVTAGDGVPLEGTLRRADGPGAVLFVHATGSRRTVFTPYAQLLFVDEISSLAIDLRGHGGSRADSMLSYESMSPYNRDRLADDVVAAYRYLESTLGLEPDHVAIVAEGTSCAIIEKAMYRGRIAAPIVDLSPSFPETDPEFFTAVSFHTDRPALIMYAREDLNSFRASQIFSDTRERRSMRTRIYEDAGHGVEVLRRVPEALDVFQRWLRRVVGSG